MSFYDLVRRRTVRDAVDEALGPRRPSIIGGAPWADPNHDVLADFRRVLADVTLSQAQLTAAYEPDYVLYTETHRVAMAKMFRDLGWSE